MDPSKTIFREFLTFACGLLLGAILTYIFINPGAQEVESLAIVGMMLVCAICWRIAEIDEWRKGSFSSRQK